MRGKNQQKDLIKNIFDYEFMWTNALICSSQNNLLYVAVKDFQNTQSLSTVHTEMLNWEKYFHLSYDGFSASM